MVADPNALFDSPQAESYEKYVQENWDKLQPWEQRQAQAFLFARLHSEDDDSRVRAIQSANQPFLNDVVEPVAHPEVYWTIKCGWACAVGTLFSPFILGPLGVFFGVYNVWKGEQEKGIFQIGLTILIFVVMMILLAAGQEIVGKLIPGPEYLIT